MRKTLMVAALVMACGPALAQTGSDSTMCRLFPLACPGPTPPKPQPLLGPPEDQAAAPAAEPTSKVRHHARKRVAKHAPKPAAQ